MVPFFVVEPVKVLHHLLLVTALSQLGFFVLCLELGDSAFVALFNFVKLLMVRFISLCFADDLEGFYVVSYFGFFLQGYLRATVKFT